MKKFLAESAFINAETRGLTHRKLRCRIWGHEESDRDRGSFYGFRN